MVSQASKLNETTTLISVDVGEATQEIADSQSEDEEYDLDDDLDQG